MVTKGWHVLFLLSRGDRTVVLLTAREITEHVICHVSATTLGVTRPSLTQ